MIRVDLGADGLGAGERVQALGLAVVGQLRGDIDARRRRLGSRELLRLVGVAAVLRAPSRC
jgi:hypothetical protein